MPLSKVWAGSLVLLAAVSLPLQAASPVKVGSKIDTEGALLGNIILQVLESHGVPTVNKVQLGTTPVVRGALQQEMTRIHRLLGRTIVLVTHDIDEALRLAEHLVLMDHGEVVQQGNPLTMLTRPTNDFVRQFFGHSELGVRLLSLRSVADYVRREERAEGEALAEEMTLRDALSLFVARGCEVLPVVNTQGEPCGTLHFQDLLEEA